jgi:hypothetical protein
MRHELYSIWSLDRASARYYRFDVNACHSTPVEHAARFFITANCDPPCGGPLSFRTFAIHKCFFNSKGAWHIDCAYSVFNKDERR